MDTVINFLEKYWGVTLAGSLTFGTLITFIVTQIKILIKDKIQSTNLKTSLSKIDELCNELNKREEQHKQERAKLEQQISVQQTQLQQTNAYFDNVIAATFQAISYLVIASKLPTEDKIVLQEKFTNLLNIKTTEYKETIKDEIQALTTEVSENIIPDAKQTVTEVVEETKTLLDKYMKEGK